MDSIVSGGTHTTPHTTASAVSHPTAASTVVATVASTEGAEADEGEDALDVLLSALGRSDDDLNLLLFPFGEVFQEAYALLDAAQKVATHSINTPINTPINTHPINARPNTPYQYILIIVAHFVLCPVSLSKLYFYHSF